MIFVRNNKKINWNKKRKEMLKVVRLNRKFKSLLEKLKILLAIFFLERKTKFPNKKN